MSKPAVRNTLRLALLMLLVAAASSAQVRESRLMPQPAKMTFGAGRMPMDENFRVKLSGYTEARLTAAATRLVDRLSRKTGVHMMAINAALPKAAATASATLDIQCDHASLPVQKLNEDESYRLEVAPGGARLTAPTPLGVLRGLETFSQLVELDSEGFGVPAVEIEDQPRFAWRGLLLDVSRHFESVETVKRILEGMAALKLNTFHWHLSDDQGFRVECKKYPKLHELGSEGQYYTQDQIREVIAYARERGIRVVPEFDMPGHTTAWFAAYPELRTAAGPTKIEDTWGILDACMDVTKEELYTFLDGFVGEMTALFPDDYFHIGGDEVNGREWNRSAAIRAFKQAQGIKTNEELQAYFNKRLQPIVTKYGKKVMGWDEIFTPGLPKDIVVHSWRGPKALAEAARQGYQAILSNGYYTDLMYPAARHYLVDPLEGPAASLTPEQKKLILGGEACQWSEFVVPENVESRIFPRLAPIAERLWSPAGVKDVESMYRRMAIVDRELEWVGIRNRANQARMYKRLAGDFDPAPVKVLGDIVEPVKDYVRPGTRKYTRQSPLNRLIDAIDPESLAAREFNLRANRVGAGGAAASGERTILRGQLTQWRDNDARLEPILQTSPLLREHAAISELVSRIAALALQSLDNIESGRKPAPEWVKEQQAFLDASAKKQGELLIMIIPGVRALLNASATTAQAAAGGK